MRLTKSDLDKQLNDKFGNGASLIWDQIMKNMAEELMKPSLVTIGNCSMCREFKSFKESRLCDSCLKEAKKEYKGHEKEYSFEDFIMAKKLANELEEL